MDTSKIDYYIEVGKKDRDWYHDCENIFVELFGKERLDLVTSLFAATSINTSLKANISLFRKALYEIENDLPVGNYLPNIQNQLYRIRAGEELSGIKISSFKKAMSGDKNAVVVDVWLARAFKVERRYFRQQKNAEKGRGRERSGGVSDKMYKKIQTWVRRKAKKINLEPRQVSSMIWAGVRIVETGDRETHYKTILKNKLTNLFGVI